MNDLFKTEKPKRTKRCYRVENLNPEKGIISSMRVSEEQKKYVVCLCLPNRIINTSFKSELSAFEQLTKYRQLYKQKKGK